MHFIFFTIFITFSLAYLIVSKKVYNIMYKIWVNWLLPVTLLLNSRLLVVKLWGSPKLYMEFQWCRRWVGSYSTLFKGQLYTNKKITLKFTYTVWEASQYSWKLESVIKWAADKLRNFLSCYLIFFFFCFSTLPGLLQSMDLSTLKCFPPGQPEKFSAFLDKVVGLQK